MAEILFDESKFALLPEQGAFLRAQVSMSDAEGLLKAGVGGHWEVLFWILGWHKV